MKYFVFVEDKTCPGDPGGWLETFETLEEVRAWLVKQWGALTTSRLDELVFTVVRGEQVRLT